MNGRHGEFLAIVSVWRIVLPLRRGIGAGKQGSETPSENQVTAISDRTVIFLTVVDSASAIKDAYLPDDSIAALE